MSDMIAGIRAEAERPRAMTRVDDSRREPVQRSRPFAKNAKDGAPAARVRRKDCRRISFRLEFGSSSATPGGDVWASDAAIPPFAKNAKDGAPAERHAATSPPFDSASPRTSALRQAFPQQTREWGTRGDR